MTAQIHARAELIERLARRAEQAGWSAPAILFLETYKPLAFLGAQFLWATQPLLNIWFASDDLRAIAQLLEDRAAVNELIARLESHAPARS
ncbi:MAG: hypothetical protein HY070_10740 [Chloroflexi bacterium]|nr:hypothetical protein [Chloroflexota bacterium]MBI3741565.1 hypothetical protein [Chloroflexota bacterium]